MLILLLTGALYGGLIWYPRKAAETFAGPVSADFAEALETYRAAVGTFPPGATDPSVMIDAGGRMTAAIPPARDALTAAQNTLEAEQIAQVPVISDRPPLDEAGLVEQELSAFYPAAREVIGRLERVADYVSALAPALAGVDQMVAVLSGPVVEEGSAPQAVPMADEVVATLEGLAVPDETGGLHSALLAVAQEIREDVGRLAAFGEPSPLAKARLAGLRNDLATFRETVGKAGVLVRRAGLGRPIAEAKEAATGAISALLSLRDEHALSGITVPDVEEPAAGVSPD